MKFQECEHCGAALDFGEKCNCQEESELKRKQYESLFCIDADGQYKIGGNGMNKPTGNFKVKALRTLKGCYIKDKVYEFIDGKAELENDIYLIGCQDFAQFEKEYVGASSEFVEVTE